MNGILFEIFKLCLTAKELGCDAFFEYSPHVELICVKVFIHGWKTGADPDVQYEWYASASKPCELRKAADCLEFLEVLIDERSR